MKKVSTAVARRHLGFWRSANRRKNQLRFHWAIADAVFQRHAIEIFHDDERLVTVLSDFVNRADVGVIQS